MDDPKKPDANKAELIGCGAVVLIFIFALVQCYSCAHMFDSPSPSRSSSSSSYSSSPSSSSYSSSSYRIGSKVVIPYLILGTTEANWNELVKLATQKQTDTMMQMAYNGHAFIVEDNTQAEILEMSSLYRIKVRILSGQHQGKIGWLSSEVL